MIIKNNVAFRLRRYKTTEVRTVYQIQMYVTFGGDRWITSTSFVLNNETSWNKESQCVKPGCTGSKGETALEINNALRNYREQMQIAIMYFEVNDIYPTKQQLIDKYLERIKGIFSPKPTVKQENPKIDLFEVFDLFVKDCGEKNAWTKATHEKMAALKNDLHTFDDNLSFEDLTETTLTQWMIYLRDSKKLRTPRKKKEERNEYNKEDFLGLKNSTLSKKFDFLRWFLKWATAKGYNSNLAYQSYKPTLKQTQKKVIYLTKDELRQIQSLDLSGPKVHLDTIRDIFLFCCFTGLRHSDVYNLKRTDIKDDHIEITTIKTADSLSIELNKLSRAILEKYKGIQFPGDKALPVIQNQPMNRALKELCRLAGIDEEIRITTYRGKDRQDVIKKKWELVGTHTGRRTFIVSALSLGIPPNVVMKWTGHSDYKAMKPYIDIADKIKAESMSKFDLLL